MGWVSWLKGLAEKLPDEAGAARPRAAVAPRRERKRGEAYAREWVKVLEDTSPARDPMNTYTWELQPGEDTGAHGRPPRPRQPGQTAQSGQPAQPDPFDTYTWELHETDSREDPWGLKEDAAKPPPKRATGVNPYDTGVFDASWTGKFDKR